MDNPSVKKSFRDSTGLGSTLRSKPLSRLDRLDTWVCGLLHQLETGSHCFFSGSPVVTQSTCQGINLRRNDGSALNMKNLREPMGMVMKVSGEARP